MPVNLVTNHYRFGVDELAETTHGWYAAEDANPASGVIPVNTTFLLRFNVQETGATAAANVDNQFQCSRNGGAFQNITTTSTIVKAVAAAALTDAGNCTKRLSGTGTFESSGAGQTEDGLSGGNNNDIAASGCSETECGLQIVGTDVAAGDILTFRLTSPDFTITNNVVPTLKFAFLPSVFDAVTVTEDTPVILLQFIAETFDEVTVTEDCTVVLTGGTPAQLTINVASDVTVTEDTPVQWLLPVDVADALTVLEDTAVSLSRLTMEVFDALTVTEETLIVLGQLIIEGTFDAVGVEEAVIVLFTSLHIDLADEVTVVEDQTVSLVTGSGTLLTIEVSDVVWVGEEIHGTKKPRTFGRAMFPWEVPV